MTQGAQALARLVAVRHPGWEWGSYSMCCSSWPAPLLLGSLAILVSASLSFPFPFNMDSREWVGNYPSEGPTSLGQRPGIFDVQVASAVTQLHTGPGTTPPSE